MTIFRRIAQIQPLKFNLQIRCRCQSILKKFTPVLAIGLISALTACDSKHSISESAAVSETTQTQSETLKYQHEFDAWKQSQNPQTLLAYEDYFKAHLKQPPSLYVLTVNTHPFEQDCEQYRFALPPKQMWHNLLPALQLVEQLQQQGIFAEYKIVSVYRSPEANRCARGAKASKHLNNYAVDFKPLDESLQPYADDAAMDQKLCAFWHKHGQKLHLGLGLYGKQRYHIDRQGYRTWGVGYGSATSPCLKR